VLLRVNQSADRLDQGAGESPQKKINFLLIADVENFHEKVAHGKVRGNEKPSSDVRKRGL
jgi:hypothetical protein